MTITHEPPALTRHAVPLDRLTPAQRRIVDLALDQLGIADGLIEDEPTETDPATRALITWTAAAVIGLTVTPGHEIAQCYDCAWIFDGAHVSDIDGRLYCPDCRPHTSG